MIKEINTKISRDIEALTHFISKYIFSNTLLVCIINMTAIVFMLNNTHFYFDSIELVVFLYILCIIGFLCSLIGYYKTETNKEVK